MAYIIQSFQKFFVSIFVLILSPTRTALCKSVLRALGWRVLVHVGVVTGNKQLSDYNIVSVECGKSAYLK